MTVRLRQLSAAVVLVLAPVLVAGVGLLTAGELPDPVPTHWNRSGEVDATMPLASFTVAIGIGASLASLAGLVLVAAVRRGAGAVAGAMGAAWLAWLLAGLYAATASAASGAASAADVDLPIAALLVAVAAPVAVAFLVRRLLPVEGRRAVVGSVPASPLALAPGERVVWVGGASSRRLLVSGLVLAVLAMPLWFAVWPAAVTAMVAAIALAWIHVVTVRVDDAEVTVSWGPVLWPRVRVGLDGVASASAEDVEPLHWGGWGYRRTPRGRAALVRRGPALVLTLTDGQRFAVTVDRPEAAADLVNAVLARASC